MNTLISCLVAIKDDPIQGVLEDLQAQTIADQIEIIVVDGSEREETKEKLKGVTINVTFDYVHRPGFNIYQAWNEGMKRAHGKFLTNANADDRHLPIALEVMAHEIEKRGVGIVYADCLLRQKGREIGIWRQPDWEQHQGVTTCPFGPQPLWRKDAVKEDFDEGLLSCADYEYFLRVAWKHGAYHIPRILGIYNENRSGFSMKHSNVEETTEMLSDYRQQLGGPVEMERWHLFCQQHRRFLVCATRQKINFAKIYTL